jgi:hypothetical protein
MQQLSEIPGKISALKALSLAADWKIPEKFFEIMATLQTALGPLKEHALKHPEPGLLIRCSSFGPPIFWHPFEEKFYVDNRNHRDTLSFKDLGYHGAVLSSGVEQPKILNQILPSMLRWVDSANKADRYDHSPRLSSHVAVKEPAFKTLLESPTPEKWDALTKAVLDASFEREAERNNLLLKMLDRPCFFGGLGSRKVLEPVEGYKLETREIVSSEPSFSQFTDFLCVGVYTKTAPGSSLNQTRYAVFYPTDNSAEWFGVALMPGSGLYDRLDVGRQLLMKKVPGTVRPSVPLEPEAVLTTDFLFEHPSALFEARYATDSEPGVTSMRTREKSAGYRSACIFNLHPNVAANPTEPHYLLYHRGGQRDAPWYRGFYTGFLNLGDHTRVTEDFLKDLAKKPVRGDLGNFHGLRLANEFKLWVSANMENLRLKEEADLGVKIVNTLESKLNAVEAGTWLKVNQHTMVTKDEVTYDGLSIKHADLHKGVSTVIKTLGSPDRLDYDTLIDALGTKGGEFSVGGVSINVETRGKLGYINGTRINVKELLPVLRRASCFTTTEDFDTFLKGVSKLSLKIHRYIANGIIFSVHIPPAGLNAGYSVKSANVKLILERHDPHTYVKLGAHLCRVTDINKLLSLSNKGSMPLLELYNILAKSVVLPEDPGFLNQLVEEGKKEYLNAKAKSKKLLEEAAGAVSARFGTYHIKGSGSIQGYQVVGKKDTYYVTCDPEADNPESPKVYRGSGEYVCIVDTSQKQVGFDAVVNRLYALKNDTLLAKQIHTL